MARRPLHRTLCQPTPLKLDEPLANPWLWRRTAYTSSSKVIWSRYCKSEKEKENEGERCVCVSLCVCMRVRVRVGLRVGGFWREIAGRVGTHLHQVAVLVRREVRLGFGSLHLREREGEEDEERNEGGKE